ncbi:MAG: formylglycine-generating enzyme family protein [Burkholderiales bacterium]|nr:formylglycine-generating enzyme family protein [Burkholderiales bacterium]
MGATDRHAHTAIGRATLLRALRDARELTSSCAVVDVAMLEHSWAGLLGFHRDLSRTESTSSDDTGLDVDEAAPLRPPAHREQAAPVSPRKPLSASFFVITHFDAPFPGEKATADEGDAARPQVEPLRPQDCQPRSRQTPPHQSLVPMTRLWPAVRRSMSSAWSGRLDVLRLVRALAAARPPRRVPRQRVSGIAGTVQVWWDVADHLTPYRQDYLDLLGRVHRLVGDSGLQVLEIDALPTQALSELVPQRTPGSGRGGVAWVPVESPGAVTARHQAAIGTALLPPPGSTVVVLGDAGNLAADPGAAQVWSAWLRELAARRCQVVLWVPCGPAWIDPAHTRLAQVHALVTGAALRAPLMPLPDRTPSARAALAERRTTVRDRLLTRAALSIHLAPPLLRALRVGDALLAAEPAAEALAWGAGERVHRSQVSRALRPEWVGEYREHFARLLPEQQVQVLDAMLAAHASLGRSTETTEVLIWQAHAARKAVEAEHTAVDTAQGWAQAWTQRIEIEAAAGTLPDTARAFAADLLARTAADERFIASQRHWTSRLWALSQATQVPKGLELTDVQAARQALDLSRRTVPNADRFRLATRRDQLLLVHDSPEFLVDVRVLTEPIRFETLLFVTADGGRRVLREPGPVTRLATLGNPGQTLQLAIDDIELELAEALCPAWADEWGEDQRGHFAWLSLGAARQCLRYIPPGRFRMGSPDGIGHVDERPQHVVLLTDGYWLADTPCTQALWQAVMGDNPSEFKDGPDAAERPVERVSYDHVQTFLQRLRKLLPQGCEPTLPTEAQWEYAARAGTSAAYWWGDEFDETKANTDVNDERDVDGSKGATTPVGRCTPNPWGLHDVHGNVWEWCSDDIRAYASEPVRHPRGDGESYLRAVRGGSWFNDSGSARSAYRGRGHRTNADQNRGFRLALRPSAPVPVPVPGAGGPGQRSDPNGIAAQLVGELVASSGQSDYLSYAEMVLARSEGESLQDTTAQTAATKEPRAKPSFAGNSRVPPLSTSRTKHSLNPNLGRRKTMGRR